MVVAIGGDVRAASEASGTAQHDSIPFQTQMRKTFIGEKPGPHAV